MVQASRWLAQLNRNDKMSEMYVLITDDDTESVYATYSELAAMTVAQDFVNQCITDYYSHMLPMRVSEGDFDVRLVEVGEVSMSTEVTLPIQHWIDEYYTEKCANDAKRAAATFDPEWAEYQRLSEKFREIG